MIEQIDETATVGSPPGGPGSDRKPVRTPTAAQTSPRLLIIRPTSGWRSLDFAELWRFRELLTQMTLRDVQVRYKQTVLGVAWAIIQPLMTMIVFTVFFGRLGGMAKYAPEGVPFQVFVYAALLPWQFFAFGLNHGGMSLIQSQRLISKVYFPRLLLPFSTAATAFVDFCISGAVLALMMLYYRIPLTWNLLLLPLLVIGMTLAALGAATLFGSLAVTYRDFRYLIAFLGQIWMFASPVAYPMDRVTEQWRLVYALNPMAGVIDGYSSALLGLPIHWDTLLISIASSTVFLILGLVYFRRVERRFADIV